MQPVHIPEELRTAVMHLQHMAVEKFRGELAAQFRINAVEGDNSSSVWSGNEPAVWRQAAELALTMPFEEGAG